jgi:hypothetical protein
MNQTTTNGNLNPLSMEKGLDELHVWYMNQLNVLAD